MVKELLYSWRKRFAEWLHPENANPDYWIRSSLGRTEIDLNVEDLSKRMTASEIRVLGKTLYKNELLNFWLSLITKKEANYLAKEAQTPGQFNYSRAIIHIIETIKEKLKSYEEIASNDDFDQFKVI